MIEQPIAKQYHILPSEQGDLSYSDWSKLVSGLMHDTPLGQVVTIRSEDDKDVLKKTTPEQRAIRSEWIAFRTSHMQYSAEDMRRQSEQLEKMIASLFG